MLKRLFRRKATALKNRPLDQESLPGGPVWGQPQTPYHDYFNLHVHGADLDRVEASLAATFLYAAGSPGPAVLLRQAGAWTSAYFLPDLARRAGFNKLASEIAQQLQTWVIAYRVYADEGIDAHYFQGPAHVDQIAVSEHDIAFEPYDAGAFSALADVSQVVPRPVDQHPLDFHFALLAALGIGDAAWTWEQAVARHLTGDAGDARLLTASPAS